jgi:hypothetical protein
VTDLPQLAKALAGVASRMQQPDGKEFTRFYVVRAARARTCACTLG